MANHIVFDRRLWVGVYYRNGTKEQMVFDYGALHDWMSAERGMWRRFRKEFGRVPDRYTVIDIWS